MVRYSDRYSIEDLLRLATHVYGRATTPDAQLFLLDADGNDVKIGEWPL